MNNKLKVYVVGGSTFYANWIYDKELINRAEEADIILFTGGEDVDPSYYGEKKGNRTYSNIERDKREKVYFDAFPDTFKLGICRGSQFLTVMAGGKLIQHVNNHGMTHQIVDLRTNKDYKMTSTHHQMHYPFDVEHELIAAASPSRSTTYLNGDNEEISLPKGFAESEIVYYPKIKALGIQGHPEMVVDHSLHYYLNSLIRDYIHL